MIWIVPIALAGAFFFASHSVGASPPLAETSDANLPSMDDLLKKWGAVYGVEWQLLKAIAMKESSLNPNAVNTADNESIGLMQVLCRPDGQRGCGNNLNVDGWTEATRKKLFDPDFNIRIGAQILAWNIRTYRMPKAIAVYNRWSERKSHVVGPFENQSYVDAVLDNRMRKTSIDIRGDTRAEPCMLPDRQLADGFELFGQLKQTRLERERTQSYSLHLLFDKLAVEVQEISLNHRRTHRGAGWCRAGHGTRGDESVAFIGDAARPW